MKEQQIFLICNQNRTLVKKVVAELHEHYSFVFEFDHDRNEKMLQHAAMESSIKNSILAILFIAEEWKTKDTSTDSYLQEELNVIASNNKKLIIVSLDGTTVDQCNSLSQAISTYQFVDFTDENSKSALYNYLSLCQTDSDINERNSTFRPHPIKYWLKYVYVFIISFIIIAGAGFVISYSYDGNRDLNNIMRRYYSHDYEKVKNYAFSPDNQVNRHNLMLRGCLAEVDKDSVSALTYYKLSSKKINLKAYFSYKRLSRKLYLTAEKLYLENYASEKGLPFKQLTSDDFLELGKIAENSIGDQFASIFFLKSAEHGNVSAIYELGEYFQSKDDNFLPILCFEYSASTNYAPVIHKLGDAYLHGINSAPDYNKAFEYYTQAADAGYSPSRLAVADCYYNGQGIKQDYTKAFALYQQLSNGCAGISESDMSEAKRKLAVCYATGNGVSKDKKKAYNLFSELASKGDAQAMNDLGKYYELGILGSKDFDRAFEWYSKSASNGNSDGLNNLGRCYELGIGVDTSLSVAHKYYLQAAQKGNEWGQNNLGLFYVNGTAVDQDYKIAMDWFLKSANQGNPEARNNIGVLYEKGLGVVIDPQKAFKMYNKAGEQGYDVAQNNTGLCFMNGTGVLENHKKAFLWFEKAAKQGNSEAQKNLAKCYLEGLGISQDKEKAIMWFKKSAQQGNSEAKRFIEECYSGGKGAMNSDATNSVEVEGRIPGELKEYFVTTRFRIRIDKLYNGKYKYTSWKLPKTALDKPDLVLKNGEYDYYSDTYTFFGGNGWVYRVNDKTIVVTQYGEQKLVDSADSY